MNKKISLVLSMLLSVNAFGGMRQQQQQHQQYDQAQQTNQKNDSKKQRWYSNDDLLADHQQQQQKPESQEDDTDVADLKSDMAAIMQNIVQQDVSVDNFIKEKQKKKRMILCGICFKPECPFTQEVYE